jgi:hypothetical protein
VISANYGAYERQHLLNTISGERKAISAGTNSLLVGDPLQRVQVEYGSMPEQKAEIQALLSSLDTKIDGVNATTNTLSATAVTAIVAGTNEIESKDYVQEVMSVLGQLGDPDSLYPTAAWDLKLDGASIKRQVTAVNMVYNEDTVHNSIEIESMDRNLFVKANPSVSRGTSRLTLEVGTRTIEFLLEERSGGEVWFTLWGRSLSAMDDEPYADGVSVLLEAPQLASSVADGLLSRTLTWSTIDWNLPKGWEYEGSPIETVQAIANAVGAVVRCNDDGEIVVRRRYPTRPVALQSSSNDVDFDRMENLIAADVKYVPGTGYDAVEVFGYAGDSSMPQMEVEAVEGNRIIGSEAFIRVYWAGKKPNAAIAMWVSDGLVEDLGEFVEAVDTETVIFQNGRATVDYPVESLLTQNWIGSSLGTITAEQNSKELASTTEGWGVAEVKYETRYQRYRTHSHYVTLLLGVLSIDDPTQFSSLLVYTEEGENPAPSITDGLITSEGAAKERGMAWLDENKYDRVQSQVVVPYYDGTIDGNVARVSDAEVGAIGNFHIQNVNTRFEGPKIVSRVGIEQCQL